MGQGYWLRQKVATQMGLEPTTFGSEVRRAIHYATRPNLGTQQHLALKVLHFMKTGLLGSKADYGLQKYQPQNFIF